MVDTDESTGGKISSGNMQQATDGVAILIGAHLLSVQAGDSQTMVKLCKNGKEWLSPTGWSHTGKSTLLDSDNDGDLIRFTIPRSFASDIKSGDEISLKISSMDFEETMSWTDAETSSVIAVGTALAVSASKATKRGLFGRFGVDRKVDVRPQSEIERLAEEARIAAKASSAEMRRAHLAKQAAEERALVATRLVEAAHKTEQERILEADRATKTLAKAEAAKRAEEKHIEAERVAEEARLVEEARIEELARCQQLACELDEERIADIKRLSREISNTKDAISNHEDMAQDLSDRAKKAKIFVKSQGEMEAQARRTFELAERKVGEGEAELAKRLQVEQTTKDELKRIEKTVSEQQKLSDKAASVAQKVQSALVDEELAAKEAAAKVSELRITSRFSQDEAQSLQRSLRTYQQQAQDLDTQKNLAETAGTAARSTLEQAKDSLGSAKGCMKDASNIHAEAGNAMRLTDGLIAENQVELQNVRDRATKMRTRVKHLKAQKITADNVSEMADILKIDPDMFATTLKKAATQKVAAQKTATLASGLGGGALIMSADSFSVGGYSPGMMSKLKGLFNQSCDKVKMKADKILSTTDVSTGDVTNAVLAKKNEKAFKEVPLPKEVFIAKNEAPDEPVVKLVDETGKTYREQPDREDNYEDLETGGMSSKAVMGLSAVLLLSVASIGVIASNVSSLKPAVKANAEKIRITTQAVLPATVSAKEIIPAIENMVAPVPQAGFDSKDVPTLVEPKADIDAILLKLDVIDITPVVLVAENTALPKRIWDDGTINLNSAPKAAVIKKLVRGAARIVPKKRASVPIRRKAVSVIIPVAPTTIQAAPTEISYSEITKDMQTKLATLGFYSGATTGYLDVATISAMNDFQKLFDQVETKIITPALLNELNNTRIVTTSLNAPLVPEVEVIEQQAPILRAPKMVASITPAEIKVETPAEEEPALAPELIVAAKKTKSGVARYPAVAKSRGHNETANVAVVYDVNADGKVLNVTIKEVSGVGYFQKAFEKSAIKASKKAKFIAKTVNGEAVTSRGHKTKFTFIIE